MSTFVMEMRDMSSILNAIKSSPSTSTNHDFITPNKKKVRSDRIDSLEGMNVIQDDSQTFLSALTDDHSKIHDHNHDEISTKQYWNGSGKASLLLIDELGRGTSNIEGLSLSYAIAENLVFPDSHSQSTLLPPPPLVLFSTHYHLISSLSTMYPTKIRSFHLSSGRRGQNRSHDLIMGNMKEEDLHYGIRLAEVVIFLLRLFFINIIF